MLEIQNQQVINQVGSDFPLPRTDSRKIWVGSRSISYTQIKIAKRKCWIVMFTTSIR
jgi:hypothetical protein